ncbi:MULTISPECIES: hypothetical protein [unclassified Chelatococcus]|uniref:hypothetical protein n=1 Tax=unclassified Chelatococcus TaxID=2638111 RepID=UPI001BCF0C2E|nr:MULTISPECIES: hypothetical protein [unclassified Chelatococcus]MBS7701584.1 hypothetical protein [Chelatococcus sp. YT9]MBX3557419.1 hypothetical protein [Chelatococcus sp.]
MKKIRNLSAAVSWTLQISIILIGSAAILPLWAAESDVSRMVKILHRQVAGISISYDGIGFYQGAISRLTINCDNINLIIRDPEMDVYLDATFPMEDITPEIKYVELYSFEGTAAGMDYVSGLKCNTGYCATVVVRANSDNRAIRREHAHTVSLEIAPKDTAGRLILRHFVGHRKLCGASIPNYCRRLKSECGITEE